jgi:quercetin dioxygenase-like cupin family protein
MNLIPAHPVVLSTSVEYSPESIVSHTLFKGDGGSLTLFAFDAGQELSEHTSPLNAFVVVVDGVVELTIGGKRVSAAAGEIVMLPANVPHAVSAPGRFKMLLAMLRP